MSGLILSHCISFCRSMASGDSCRSISSIEGSLAENVRYRFAMGVSATNKISSLLFDDDGPVAPFAFKGTVIERAVACRVH